jgi:hypothetical protein
MPLLFAWKGENSMRPAKKERVLVFLVLLITALISSSPSYGDTEIREYQGKPLDPFDREYDNSIKGPQSVDPE